MTHRYYNKTQHALLTLSLAVLFGTTAMTASFATQALAQDPDQEEFVLEEIVITGSRIVRNNMNSPSPIVTVDESLFDQSATMAIETQLNKLPQFTPTMDIPQAGGGDIQPNTRNTPGEATISLRGLGPNRSLVLINGRRGTPSNAMGVVDINTIPVAAIEYVEAITGGASSTYGADAMAGVVNFIMKERFEGLEIDLRSGITEEGDNFESQVSGIMGTDIADDRGNISLAFSYNKRDEAFQRDRDWYRWLWANPTIGGTQFFSPFAGFTPGIDPTAETAVPGVYADNLPDPNVVNTVMGIPAGEGFLSLSGVDIFVDNNGQAFTGFGFAAASSLVPGTVGTNSIVDGIDIIQQADGKYAKNFTDNYLIFPLDRYNLYTRGNYEINDWVGVFMQGYFSKTHTLTVQEPGPITSGWAVNIDPTINRAVIPAELLTILDSRTREAVPGEAGYDPDPALNATVSGADAPFMLKGLLPFNRGTETEVYTYNLISGLEGEIPQIDWTWELFVSQGEAETTTTQSGVVSLQRLDAIMNWGPNFGQGAVITGNAGPPNFNFGASTATCTSGINPFDMGSTSQDCWDAVAAPLKSKQVMEQTIWETNLQGPVTDLPAGEMRGALGASYREQVYEFQNDILITQGSSFLEQSLGIYPLGNSEGTIDAREAYAELLVPVMSDIPGIEQLNLEIGGRRSDYNTTGVSYTYKALLDWRTINWLRVRGGFNRAERAPNIGELYMAPEQTFDFVSGDVCSTSSFKSYGANAAFNPEHWDEVVTICGELMRASGNPTADTTYYGIPYEEILAGNPPTNDLFMAALFAAGFPTKIGNPNLKPEKADTWTMGVVIDSPFDEQDHPALLDWRVSIDYYIIDITDAIGIESADFVMQRCVDPEYNPTLDINHPYCQLVHRNQTGAIGPLEQTFHNDERLKNSGIDLSLNWGMEAGPGRVGVNTLFNYLIKDESAEGNNPMIDYVGFGANFEWQALTEVSYIFHSLNDLRLAVRWQHLDSVENIAAATNPGNTLTGAPAYDLFDLLGSYNLMDNVLLRFGIENVFNKEPPLIGVNPAATDGMYGGSYDATNYDINGRRFYMGARLYF